jgi:hypothetical protein
MALEIVAAPGAPALELAFGFGAQIGSLGECGFGQLVHEIRPSFAMFQPLNPIRRGCANPDGAAGRRKALESTEMGHKRPFRSPSIFLIREP